MSAPLRPQRVSARPLRELLARLPDARQQGGEVAVTGITHDAREVRPGDLYLARPGARTHGIAYVGQALAAGARAVLTDEPSAAAARAAGAEAVVTVPDPRAAGGPAAAWVYGDPAVGLLLLGVTGTNGKTSTCYLLDAGLRAGGRRSGLIGTVETRVADTAVPSPRTTPEATDLQALFAVMREAGVEAVAMEVSSHALALDRVAGTTFDVAAFTNLSQDHLDFHAGMEDYYAAKRRLFEPAYSRRAVVTVDDGWGRRLAGEATVPVTTVGVSGAAWCRQPQVADGTLALTAPDGERHELRVRLAGSFNAANAALAYVTLLVAGVPAPAARAGLATLDSVPGRMERVHAGQPFTVLVDYAHTPEAVTLVLAEARALAAGRRVIGVLGCGGDRDRAKRPLMGAALSRGADVAVLTSDNPRSEDPAAILAEMLAGVAAGVADVVVEPDRAAAIATAVRRARPGDVVVIAGKGHESGQEVGERRLPFDDRAVAAAALHALGFGSES